MIKKALAIILCLSLIAPPVWGANENEAELNPLLGDPVLMDGMACAQKYGAKFCRCDELPSGKTACYYSKPSSGPYDSMNSCEEVWGEGGCECKDTESGGQMCYELKDQNVSEPLGCDGQIMMFPGEKFECRKSGLMTFGNDCCWEETGDECSFEETAEMMGMSDAVIKAAGSLTQFFGSDYLSQQMAQQFPDMGVSLADGLLGSGSSVLEGMGANALEAGYGLMDDLAADALTEGIGETVSQEAVNAAISAGAEELAGGASKQAAQAAMQSALVDQGVSEGAAGSISSKMGTKMAGEGMNQAMTNAVAQGAVTGIITLGMAMADGQMTTQEMVDSALAITTTIFGGGWLYMGYKAFMLYNQMMENSKCNTGEKILACKVGAGYCHYVGSDCKMEIFGACLQDSKQFCCFSSKLARIIHEQGRSQVSSLSWGDGEDPNCRGFWPNEFAKLDFAKMDMSEYSNDIARRVNDEFGAEEAQNVKKKFENRIKNQF